MTPQERADRLYQYAKKLADTMGTPRLEISVHDFPGVESLNKEWNPHVLKMSSNSLYYVAERDRIKLFSVLWNKSKETIPELEVPKEDEAIKKEDSINLDDIPF